MSCKVCSHVWCMAGDYQWERERERKRYESCVSREMYTSWINHLVSLIKYSRLKRTHAFALTHLHIHTLTHPFFPVGWPTTFQELPRKYTSSFLLTMLYTFIVFVKIIDVPKIEVCIIYLSFLLEIKRARLLPKKNNDTLLFPCHWVLEMIMLRQDVYKCKWSRKPKAKRLAWNFMC